MPLALRVEPELDERKADEVKRDAEERFGHVRATVDPQIDRNQIEQVFGQAGEHGAVHFLSGFARGVTENAEGFETLGGLAERVVVGLGDVSLGAAAAGAGLIALGAGAVIAGEKIFELDDKFNELSNHLSAATGEVGTALQSLRDAANNVAVDTGASFEKTYEIIGQLHDGLRYLGDVDLKPLGEQIAILSERGLDLNVTKLTEFSRAYHLNVEEAGAAVDQLYTASTRTGESINQILGPLDQVSTSIKNLGGNFEGAINLMDKFGEAGVEATRLNQGMAHLVETFDKIGVDPAQGFGALVEKIKEANNGTEEGRVKAEQIGQAYFGNAQMAQKFVEMIAQGQIDADTLRTKIDGSTDSVKRMGENTSDWHEKWHEMSNAVDALLDKMTGPFYTGVADTLGKISDAVKDIATGLQSWHLPDWMTAPPPDWLKWAQNLLNPAATLGGPPNVDQNKTTDPDDFYKKLYEGANPATPPSQFQPKQGAKPFVGPIMPGQAGDFVDIDGKTYRRSDVEPRSAADPNSIPDDPNAKRKTGSDRVVLPLGAAPAQQPGEPDQQYQAELRVWEAQHDLAEKKATLTKTQQDQNHTEEELVKANNDVTMAELREQEAERALIKAKQQKVSEAQVPYPEGFGAPPRPGETAEQYGKEQNYYEAVHKRQEAEARLQQLQADSNTSPENLTEATNTLTKAREGEYEAMLRLNEQSKKSRDNLDELGAKIDADFGVSKGLPGIADNLVKFIANLVAAPVFGALKGVDAAQGGPTYGASGLLGMAALGGAFGPQYTPAALSGQQGNAPGYSSPAMPRATDAASVAAGGTRVAALLSLANSLQGTPYSQDLRNDCSGMVSELAAAAVGLPIPAAGERFNTTNEQQWLAAHGFQPGVGGPNDLTIGFNPAPGNAGHTAATLPGGIHAEQGGANNAFTLGGAVGGESSQFPQHMFLPSAAMGGPAGPGTATAAAATMTSATISVGSATINVGSTGGTGASTAAGNTGNTNAGSATAATGSGSDNVIATGPGIARINTTRADAEAQGLTILGPAPSRTNNTPAAKPGGNEPVPVASLTNPTQIANREAVKKAFFGEDGNPNDFGMLDYIIMHESQYRTDATNPATGDFGIPQFNPAAGNIQKYLPTRSQDPYQQGGAMLQYINDRYGKGDGFSAALRRAYEYKMANGTYALGGAVGFQGGGAPGPTDTIPAMLSPGEHVLTTQDVSAMGGQQGVYAFRESLHQTPGAAAAAPQASISGPPIGPTKIGGLPPPAGQGSGFGITGGGLIGLGESAVAQAASTAIEAAIASGAAGAGAQYGGAVIGFDGGGAVDPNLAGAAGSTGDPAGGAGSLISAAINIGIQEANRAIGFAGQAAGILTSGLMETFLPTGGSELANQNWGTRIIGGIIGARPALPNIAGKQTQAQQLTQAQQTSLAAPPARAEHYGSGAPAGPVNNTGVHIENYNVQSTEDRAGQDLARHQMASNDPIGYR